MWRFFRKYPKEFLSVFMIFGVQQSSYLGFVDYVRDYEISEWFTENYKLINGATIILSGLICGYFSNFKMDLRNICIVIFTSILLVFNSASIGQIIGLFIFQIASCIFFISIFSRVAKYFVNANIQKMDVFFALFISYIGFSFVGVLVENLLYGFFPTYGNLIVHIIYFLVLIFLISNMNEHQVPRRIDGQQNPDFIKILISFVLVNSLLMLGVFYFDFKMENFTEPEFDSYFVVILISSLIPTVYSFYLLFRKKNHLDSNLIQKNLVGMSAIFILLVSLLFSLRLGYQFLLMLAGVTYSILFEYFCYCVFLAILTHNYFGKSMGLVVAIFVGFPYLISGYLDKIFLESVIYSNEFLIILACVLLLLISFVWKNKSFLSNFFRINEPQLIEEIEKEVDPLDHLIDE